MKKIKLINEFHNTEAVLIPKPIKEGRFKGLYKVSRTTAVRLRKALCGMSDCNCGRGNFGEIGGIRFEVINTSLDGGFIIGIK